MKADSKKRGLHGLATGCRRKRLIPIEQIAFIEPYDPAANPKIQTDKNFKSRIVLLDCRPRPSADGNISARPASPVPASPHVIYGYQQLRSPLRQFYFFRPQLLQFPNGLDQHLERYG